MSDESQRAAVTNAQTRLRKRWSRLWGVSWLQAGIEFFGFLWTHHSHVSNVWSARLVWRILGWWWRNIARRRYRGRRGFCGHGWRALRRHRSIYHWRDFRPPPSFARFPAVQDDAAVFCHTCPAGLDAILLQDFRNDKIGCLLAAQFHDGVMERFQIVKRNAMGIRPEFLNRLAQ